MDNITVNDRKRSRSLNCKDSEIKDRNRSFIDQSAERRIKLKKISESKLPSNIQVHVRVRPLINQEIIKSNKKSIIIKNSKQLLCGDDREFNFDLIYNEKCSQQIVFENSLKMNLEKSLEGYNLSTFAYGQTVIHLL